MNCIACGTDIDESEFLDVRDADICGWCFTDALTKVRRPGIPEPWIQLLADTTIRAEHDDAHKECHERLLRFIDCLELS